MLILGLLLLACTAAFVGLVIADNLGGGADHNVTVLGNHIATMNGLAIFCAGLALALIFGLGLMLAMGGLAMRRRRTRKLVGAAQTDAAAIARERDELAARLDQIHAEHMAAEQRGAATAPEAGAAGTAATADDQHVAATGGSTAQQDAPRHRHSRHFFGR